MGDFLRRHGPGGDRADVLNDRQPHERLALSIGQLLAGTGDHGVRGLAVIRWEEPQQAQFSHDRYATTRQLQGVVFGLCRLWDGRVGVGDVQVCPPRAYDEPDGQPPFTGRVADGVGDQLRDG